ncbi:MAG: DUF58 domain-containing protein [Caldilineaceae bacterium]
MSQLQQQAGLQRAAPLQPQSERLPVARTSYLAARSGVSNLLHALWNRGLPAHIQIRQQVVWPLFLIPIVLFNQITTPHPMWVILLVTLVGLYGVALLWVRSQAQTVTMERRRLGTILVAGDQLEEEFTLRNGSPFPVIWAEVRDASTLPGYQTGRVVGCGSNNSYRWNSKVTCRHRGVYYLGPYQLHLADPFGFFELSIAFAQIDTVLIYPRVLRLPAVPIPEGNQSGTARRRRPLLGVQPSAAVRNYQPTDTLRHVHWPLTAHRGELMVKEMESEPSGTVWIVLDLDRNVQQGSGETGTLEYSVITAASLTSELLQDDDRRAVGLFTISGEAPPQSRTQPAAVTIDVGTQSSVQNAEQNEMTQQSAVVIAPQSGQAQLWNVLAGLAPVEPSSVPLADLLRSARTSLGKRTTLMVITAYPNDEIPAWLPELVHLQRSGISSSVMLVTQLADTVDTENALRTLLMRHGIPVQQMVTTAQLPPALTFRRTRRIIRSTPTGGAVSFEVEEEVG